MGIESYFLNIKTKHKEGDCVERICKVLKSKGMQVIPEFKNNAGPATSIIIDRMVSMEYIESDASLCFSACFTCFEKSLKKIIAVINYIDELEMVEYAYYGNIVIHKDDFSRLEEIVEKYTEEKRTYFYTRFKKESIELPPEQFYEYYNGSRFYKWVLRMRGGRHKENRHS